MLKAGPGTKRRQLEIYESGRFQSREEFRPDRSMLDISGRAGKSQLSSNGFFRCQNVNHDLTTRS